MIAFEDTHPLLDPTIQRFMRRVEITKDGHWIWHGWIEKNGYGKFWFEGKNEWAHRVAFVLFKGVKLRRGYDIDHRCFIHGCVNPNCLRQIKSNRNRARRPPTYVANRYGRTSE